MVISIDWGASVIYVPKADTLLVQALPVEIRELDLDAFRLALKELEDDISGIGFLKTHDHSTTVTVSGVELARVINILNPYTITFEDGQYAVNLIGANSNVGDKVNVNQVSIRSSNSPGLIQTREIKHASFNGQVTIDVVDGAPGQTYPLGTEAYPVNNTQDAVSIAKSRGFSKLFIIGDITFGSGDDISNYTIEGQNKIQSTVTINPGAIAQNCSVLNSTVYGILDDNTWLEDCLIGSLDYLVGQLIRCGIIGTVTLGPLTATLVDCYSGDKTKTISIDLDGYGGDLAIRGYTGAIRLAKATNSNVIVDINMSAGYVDIDSSCTAGTIIVSGIADVVDNSGPGCTVTREGQIQTSTIKEAVLDGYLTDHSTIGTVGDALGNINTLNKVQIAANITVSAGSTALVINTSLTQSDDFFNGMSVQIINSAGTAIRMIDEYSSGIIYVSEAFPFTPSDGDTMYILATSYTSSAGGLA